MYSKIVFAGPRERGYYLLLRPQSLGRRNLHMRAFLVRGTNQPELWSRINCERPLTAIGQDDRCAKMSLALCSSRTIFLPTFYEPGPSNTGSFTYVKSRDAPNHG